MDRKPVLNFIDYSGFRIKVGALSMYTFKVQNKCSYKQIILIFWILFLPGQLIFSQDHKTKDNYTGAWETPSSWDPTWAVPQSNVNNLDITINGYITAYNSLSFSGSSSKLIVDDTLVIIGNLTIADNNDVQVNNNGILIVRGNLTISNDSKIEVKNYIIVTGNIIKLGSIDNGEFGSDDNPARVFVGGTFTPADLIDNKTNFPAFDCTSPPTTPYTHSGCSYGDMTDITTDPIYLFFQSTCANVSLTSSDVDNSFCAGTSVTFTAGGGTNYNFRVNAISVQNSVSTSYTTTTLTNGQIVDVVVTGTGGCTSTSSGITNTVFTLPAPTIGGPTSVCVGSTGNIYTTTAGMSNYLWTVSAGGTITAGGGTGHNTVTVTWTTTGAKTVTINYTNGNGCTATSPTTYNVTVNPLPVPTITGPTGVCDGAVENVYTTGAGMSNYLWTVSAGGTITAGGGTGHHTVTVTWTTTGAKTVTVNYTNGNGCKATNPTTYIVTVNTLTVATASNNGPVCAGSAVSLTGGPAGMPIYSWTGPNGFTSSLQNPSVSENITIAMAGIYNLTVTNASGCTSTASTTVTVNALPVAMASNNGPVCIGNVLSLTGGPAAMTTYAWTGPNGFTSSSQNQLVSDKAAFEMAGDYILTATSAGGCTSVATTEVTVNETPIAIAGPDQELTFVFETQMAAELSPPETGEWTLISGSGHISTIHSPTTRLTELSTGENIFLWKVQNGSCKATDEVKITVYDLFTPSVITPDGDGKNDYFKISENIGKVELIIINRWGNEEYSNSNYLNDWDGRNNSGAELPYDTYFFILKLEKGKIKRGSVLILR